MRRRSSLQRKLRDFPPGCSACSTDRCTISLLQRKTRWGPIAEGNFPGFLLLGSRRIFSKFVHVISLHFPFTFCSLQMRSTSRQGGMTKKTHQIETAGGRARVRRCMCVFFWLVSFRVG